MKIRGNCGVISTALLLTLLAAGTARAADMISDADLKTLALQRYWHTELPLLGRDGVARLAVVDDTLYVLTEGNAVYSVHAPSGIIRWSSVVAEPGQAIRGPTHARRFAFFTTPGTIRVLSREAGEPAGEPRALNGFIIEVLHDTATITIGEAHGVRAGDVLKVYHAAAGGEAERESIAELRITYVDQRQAKGRLTRLTSSKKAVAGDVVSANVVLPLSEVRLPFAASSAAAADENCVYVGASNQRFYSLEILSSLQHWQLLTPKTVSATPVLLGDTLFIAGQDGRVAAITKGDRVALWTFQCEGPVFADLAVDATRVYVASSDRSLYCLDRKTGNRVWRERFDTPLDSAPVVNQGHVYQRVPQQGLIALDAGTGKHVWKQSFEAGFLVRLENDDYLADDAAGMMLLRVDQETGKQKTVLNVPAAAFAAASRSDQSIFLATKQGEIVCLRSEKAPRLTPGQLAEALRNEARVRMRAEQDAKTKATAKPAAETGRTLPRSVIFDDDLLTSRSTAKPVGGHGLVTPEGKKAGKAEGKTAGEEAEEPAGKKVKKPEKEPAEDEEAEEESEEAAEEAAAPSEKEKPADEEGAGDSEEEEPAEE